MHRLSRKCDPSDTTNSQNHGRSLLRLIHEIERLDLVRVGRAHPARCRLATGSPGASLGREPSPGAEAHDATETCSAQDRSRSLSYSLAREIIHKLSGPSGFRAVSPAVMEEWTAWTGATTPPAVRWIRSCSSLSATQAQPCSR